MDIQGILTYFGNVGYIGIFIISFLGSILIFIPVPYFPILITSALNKELDPNMIALSATIGAVLAKSSIFLASYYGRNLLSKKTKSKILPLQNFLAKSGGLAAFIAALLPVPDDLVYIPLGIAKYSVKKFVLFTFFGKLLYGLIIVWGAVILGRPVMEQILLFSNANNQFTVILIAGLTIGLLILILFFTFKVDWTKIIGKWFPWALDNDFDEKHKNKK
ncbi:MAG TPA: VTT domain-containing protein [Candidatus Sulfopaludibacter sp.]|nr:VTT domain-containing protein [Candidatus Sulfopaludibacter sp.]